jgi:hypothetical protein
MITFVSRNGPPEALLCPAILCDVCGEPIYAGKLDDEKGTGFDGEPVNGWALQCHGESEAIADVHFVHGGDCDQAMNKNCSRDDRYHASVGLDVFLRQLVCNFEHPFEPDANQEFVAPPPSTWRVGRYERK